MKAKLKRTSCLKSYQVLRLKSVYRQAVSIRDRFMVILAVFLFALSASAYERCSSILTNEFKIDFGAGIRDFQLRSPKLQLLVWNIHKGVDSTLAEEYQFLSKYSDIVLFQESVSDVNFIKSIVNADSRIGWSQAKAYRNSKGVVAGVATGSKIMPYSETPVLSIVTEPILNSPKSFMLTEYLIQGRQETLLVANMHAINFVTNSTFKKHIDQLVSHIRDHNGPMIVAGDFNTWNSGRTSYLESRMAELNLTETKTPQSGVLTLDHIFSRGLIPHGVHDLTFVKASDHSPLIVDFLIPGI